MNIQRLAKPSFLAALLLVASALAAMPPAVASEEGSGLRLAVFSADATPPIGSPVAYAKTRSITDPLFAKGIVLLGAGEPIVLCSVDFIVIANQGHDAWREALAEAAGTSPGRVAVQVVHQHDGPRCDFGAEAIAKEAGLGGLRQDDAFLHRTIAATSAALRESLGSARPVTHLGTGVAEVEKVASNRRLLGPDGKVAIARSSSYRIPEPILSRLIKAARRQGYELSATRVEEAIAAPEGVIDPELKMVTFFDGEDPIASLSYYATHPQSFFGEGDVTSEFVGIARSRIEKERSGLPLVHFNGGAGNIAAGKYNDGTPELRVILTDRMADGMRRAWEATERRPLEPSQVEWRVVPVSLPVPDHLDETALRATLADESLPDTSRLAAAGKLSYLLRTKAGHRIELSNLRLGPVDILHFPGELFVEYQLAAQESHPDRIICMAAYGDGGPGYIGTEISYDEGGYETQPSSTNVAPEVEGVLMQALDELLR